MKSACRRSGQNQRTCNQEVFIMSKRICEMTVEELIQPGAHSYKDCGLRYYAVGKGVVKKVPEALSVLGCKRPFVVMDHNTLEAGGKKVMAVLEAAGIPYASFVFPFSGHIEPDEMAVGSLTMAMDPTCDILLAVGSGVINDCCKVAAHAAGKPSMVVGTAPSMDGYASNSGSMIQNRVKVSLYNACPQAIIGDTDILKTAPDIMLKAGIGDMLAKYVAVCEWRIASMVHGDPYDEEIAELVRRALAKIVALSDKLLARDDEAIAAVFDGLVLSGLSMAYAGNSRPASGLDHYFSHMWEMKSLREGTQGDLHGIQVAVGTQLALWVFENYLTMDKIDVDRANAAMAAFSTEHWEQEVRRIFGNVAPEILRIEAQTGKNDPVGHKKRLDLIVANWPEIRQAMKDELPSRKEIIDLMRRLQMPVTPADLGLTQKDTQDALIGSRDLRDKYLVSSLMWDIGLLDEAVKHIPYDA